MLKKIATTLSGNHFVQRILEKNILYSLNLSGIGAGAGVQNSGEKSVLNLLRFAQQPYCIFDVGANKGQYLNMVYNQLAGKNFAIHSFEPCVNTFNQLKANVPASGNVVLNNFGIGDKEGEFTIYYNEEGSSLASLTKRRLDHLGISFNKSEKIKLVTLDDYCLRNGIKHINLLKLDVEGHELNILKGAEKMFSNQSIDIAAFEFGGCNIDTRTFFQDYYYFFKEHKMRLYRITPSGYFFPIGSYKEQYEQFITTNFIAVAPSVPGPELNQ
jgi:FkbM family methyltransferase